MKSSIEARLNELSAYQDALVQQKGHSSDLALVLIAGSYLDHQLQVIVEAFFVEGLSKKFLSELTDGPTAPIGSFSARMKIAYALGLIDEREYLSINAMREIRNQFAHKVTASFNDPKLTPKFDKLAWVAGRESVGDIDRAEIVFMASVRLGTGLTNRADHVAAERRARKDWPVHRIDANLDPDYDPLDDIY